eukprot:CAMPEP_0119551400 /NCGR_PEP_ID=MMETSP1352-20130426/4667_1 /TAXON_ID=265584 /ORGANISM="Stauroneis constricta, Strain CCMP1120" /LENGTH=328 /DNA_ID=CAMNT_0007597451 /DNA_START=48 /DNA_END=1034 /DNA_ORIENTATION=+
MNIRTASLTFIAVLLSVAYRSSQASPRDSAIANFKAPNDDTPKDLAREWKSFDDRLWSYVDEHVPDVLEHTGSSAFDEHLKGVQAVLRYWKSPTHLQSAGLFHSIYGTEGFQGFSLPLSERSIIQNLIGESAEKLCFWFCMVDRSTLDKTVFAWTSVDRAGDPHDHDDHDIDDDDDDDSPHEFVLKSRPELGRFDIRMKKEEWLDFVELTLADWMEQVEGAARVPSDLFYWKEGEAYAYRRLAYKKMSEILAAERPDRLGEVAPATLEAVMGAEAAETRQLVQPRTPPMSDAAAAALDALRAVGENIPADLSPQPYSLEECKNLLAEV